MQLTKPILDAIVYMGGCIEADGWDQLQGFVEEKDRKRMFDDCLKALDWAAWKKRQRQAKSQKKPKA